MIFGFLKNKLNKLYTTITSPLKALFGRPLDETMLKELETILLNADVGIKTSRLICLKVKTAWQEGKLQDGSDLKVLLKKELIALLQTTLYKGSGNCYLLVGINGSGKTTTAAKLAYRYQQQGKRVLFIAADTFRAAATQQLEQWAHLLGVGIVTGKENQDPASVVFAGVQKFKQEGYDVLIIDTAGRLQTKVNLMKELEKIKRVISTQLENKPITTLLIIDAMLGQNSLDQAKLFNESTPLDGIILTKMDGSAKGGIIFAIAHEIKVPIAYISFGEKPENLALFDAQTFVHELLEG